MKFNSQKFKELVDEISKTESIRELVLKSGLTRSSFYKYYDGNFKKGPNEESMDRILYFFSLCNIYVQKSDFYGETPTGYDYETLASDFLKENGYDPNIINDPMLAELIKEVNKLKSICQELNQRVVDLNDTIKDKDKKISELEKELQKKK